MARIMVARTTVPLIELVHDARNGCDRSTNDLVQQCLPDLQGYLGRRGSDVPEAMANQVMAEFVRALNRLQFDTDQQIWGYIHSIARSRLIDERRRSRPEETSLEHVDIVDRHESSFDERVADKMTVENLISDLTVEQREVIQMRFMEDLSIHETAHRLGKSITAVKGLQHRAIAALAAVAAIILVLVAANQLSGDGGTYVEIEPTDPVGLDGESAPNGADDDRSAALFVSDADESSEEQQPVPDEPLIIEQTRRQETSATTIPATPTTSAQAIDNQAQSEDENAINDGADGANGQPGDSVPDDNSEPLEQVLEDIFENMETTIPVTTPTTTSLTTVTTVTTVISTTTPEIGNVADYTANEQLTLAADTSMTEVSIPLGSAEATSLLDPETFTVWDAPARGGLRFDPNPTQPRLYFVLPSVGFRTTDDYARYSVCDMTGVCYQTVIRINYTPA